MFDVVVIGAGVVGSAVARALSATRLSVCVLEKEQDVACGASRANSAIVHAGFDPEEGSLKARLNVRGAELMPALAKELGVPYRNNGSLVLAFDAAQCEHLERLLQRGIANGVPNLRILGREELLQMEPNVNPQAAAALYAPSAGIVCPYQLTIALMGNAMDNGAQLRCGFYVDEIHYTDGVFEVRGGGETVQARYIVNAAGTGCGRIAAMIGDTLTLAPKRGEYMLLDKTEGRTIRSTVFQVPSKEGKGVLVTPTVDGNLLTGPTSQEVSDADDTRTTAEGLAFVRCTASLSVPSIRWGAVITSFAGVRASLKETSDFVIDFSPHNGAFIEAAGIDSPGLSAAPAIAEYIVGLLAQAGEDVSVRADFEPKRSYIDFRHMSMEEKNAVIARDPRYGKIVCRCEQITEGEIVQAIRSNPPARSVDAVKRRTRAGMGRCQGAFCGVAVMELIARETGIGIEKVTKNGGASEMVVGRVKQGGSEDGTV